MLLGLGCAWGILNSARLAPGKGVPGAGNTVQPEVNLVPRAGLPVPGSAGASSFGEPAAISECWRFWD